MINLRALVGAKFQSQMDVAPRWCYKVGWDGLDWEWITRKRTPYGAKNTITDGGSSATHSKAGWMDWFQLVLINTNINCGMSVCNEKVGPDTPIARGYPLQNNQRGF